MADVARDRCPQDEQLAVLLGFDRLQPVEIDERDAPLTRQADLLAFATPPGSALKGAFADQNSLSAAITPNARADIGPQGKLPFDHGARPQPERFAALILQQRRIARARFRTRRQPRQVRPLGCRPGSPTSPRRRRSPPKSPAARSASASLTNPTIEVASMGQTTAPCGPVTATPSISGAASRSRLGAASISASKALSAVCSPHSMPVELRRGRCVEVFGQKSSVGSQALNV
jgi:hypothetical protein